MENALETLGPFQAGVIQVYGGVTPIMENQTKKKLERNMKNEMEPTF